MGWLMVVVLVLIVGYGFVRFDRYAAESRRKEASLKNYVRELEERKARRDRGELEGTKPAMLFLRDPRFTRWPGKLIDIPFREYRHPKWGHPDPEALLPYVQKVFPNVRAIYTTESMDLELGIHDADTHDLVGHISSPVEKALRLQRRAELGERVIDEA